MTDERRRSRALAGRLALTPPPTLTAPATYRQLLDGWPFWWDHPGPDLLAFARTLDTTGLPRGVCATLASLDESNLDADRAAAVAEVFEDAAKDTRHSEDVRALCDEYASRCRLSAAFLGDYESACRAMHEADVVAGETVDDAERRARLITRAEISYVAHAIAVETHDPKIAAQREDTRRMVWQDLVAEGGVIRFWEELDREADRATIRSAVREAMTGEVRDDTGWVPEEPTLDELVASTALAGIRVIATVDHLPGSAKDGTRPTGGGSTPRAEFAPIAGVRLTCQPLPDLAAVRAQLVSRYPHAAAVIDRILSLAVGQPYARLRPCLLVGPPGCGKTRLAREICEAMGLAVTVYSCAGVGDASFIGTSRQWGTGRASVPLQAIKRAVCPTVAIVADEIEKASTSRHNGSAQDGLLSMLDHAGRYHDPYLECDTDLSGVTFIATANSLQGITDPLRDRFLIIEMPAPTQESLPALIEGILQDLREETGQDEDWLPALDGEELAAVVEHWRPGGSIRSLRRLVEAAVASRAVLSPRH